MPHRSDIPRAYIHGALMTPNSFNYLRSRHPVSHESLPHYDAAKKSIEHNTELVYWELKGEFKDRKFDLITHSMGGVIGLTLLNKKYGLNIQRLITLSVPFAGVRRLFWAKYVLPRYHLFKDLSTNSKTIENLQGVEVKIPVLNIVTTWGSEFFGADENDGVVSVKSQKSIQGPNIITKEFCLNHMEVLLSEEVATEVRKFLEAK